MLRFYQERILVVGFVLSSSIGLDQITKRIAEQTLTETHSFLFDTFRLQFIKNSGAFLGFGSDFSIELKFWLFLFLPMVFLLGASLFVIFSRGLMHVERVLLSLIISGGIGNLIDRILLSGHVTDFMNVGIGSIRTGIFNIADMAIMAGAFGWLAFALKRQPK